MEILVREKSVKSQGNSFQTKSGHPELYGTVVKSRQHFQDRDFPRPDLGPNIGPFPIQKRAKTSQMLYIPVITNFFVLHFGEKIMKIRTKKAKLQMHENLHKNVNENKFSFTFYAIFH